MFNSYFKYFLLVTLFFPALGIGQAPGGVDGSAMWLTVEEEEEDFVFKEKKSTTLLSTVGKMELLNNNPTILFDESTSIPQIDIPSRSIDQLQVFAVFAPRDSFLEKGIWYIESDEEDELLLTTHRFVDFRTGRFMNNLKDQKHQPQLNTYQRYIDSKKEKDYRFVIGDNDFKNEIPVTPFVGKFAECIVFDRILNGLDKAKVESYLAIKYGLTIDKNLNQSLYNSEDQIIWNTKRNIDYSHNMAGVGRDNASSLYQKQSSSVYANSIFSLALNEWAADNSSNQSELNNLQFLIWGSNQQALSQEPKQPGLIQKLNRKWKLVNHGNLSLKTQLIFDLEHLAIDKTPENIYWLVIDQSGAGQFDIQSTEYFPMSDMEDRSSAIFDDISWGNSIEAHFSIAAGPKLIPVMQVEAPDCSSAVDGSLLMSARGGQAPYSFEIINESGVVFHSILTDQTTPVEFSNITAGNYQLKIRDVNGLTYFEDFFINPKDAPTSSLADQYLWNNQEELRLDASLGVEVPADYEWKLPNGDIHFGANISIDQVGNYLLTIKTEDCKSQQKIEIIAAASNNFKTIHLFPNPVSDGIYQLEVDLEHNAELEIQLVTISGVIRDIVHLNKATNHKFQGYIAAPGMYFLKLISAGSVETRKLIVHQKS